MKISCESFELMQKIAEKNHENVWKDVKTGENMMKINDKVVKIIKNVAEMVKNRQKPSETT